MRRLPATVLSILAALTVGATGSAVTPAAAQRGADDEETYLDRTPDDCITLSLVRDTTVLDDNTILFYLRGGDVYVNVLRDTCFGLEAAGRFITKTRSRRLCRVDLVEVLQQFGGSAMPGAFCRLGDFHPITREEADLLEMDADELAAARRSVVLTPLDPEEAVSEDGQATVDQPPAAEADEAPLR